MILYHYWDDELENILINETFSLMGSWKGYFILFIDTASLMIQWNWKMKWRVFSLMRLFINDTIKRKKF